MKKQMLAMATALLLPTLSLNATANDLVFTKSMVNSFKSRCEESINNYYSQVNLLIGTNLSTGDKDLLTFSAKEEFFKDENVRIESDLKDLAKDDYKVMEYLDNMAQVYGKMDAEIVLSKKDISDIYYNDKENYYYMVGIVAREISVTNKKGKTQKDKQTVDIYFCFTSKNSTIKIFSIQNHKKDLAKALPVPIAEEEKTSAVASEVPYFEFNINPASAEVFVDGEKIFYVNGEKIKTSTGEHTVEISALRYKTEKIRLNVTRKGKHFIDRTLTIKQGTLSIVGQSEEYNGANVYLDGVIIGTIPLLNYSVPIGYHKISVKKKNYFTLNEKISIEDNKLTPLNIKLVSNVLLKKAAIGTGLYLLQKFAK